MSLEIDEMNWGSFSITTYVDGSAFPAKIDIKFVSYDADTRVFVGEINWSPKLIKRYYGDADH